MNHESFLINLVRAGPAADETQAKTTEKIFFCMYDIAQSVRVAKWKMIFVRLDREPELSGMQRWRDVGGADRSLNPCAGHVWEVVG